MFIPPAIFEEFLLEVRRYHSALQARPLEPSESLESHVTCGIWRVLQWLVPEGSYGPDVGALKMSFHGYDPKTFNGATKVRVELPSGEVFIVSVTKASGS